MRLLASSVLTGKLSTNLKDERMTDGMANVSANRW
jgi:hypothetical protein